MSKGQRGRFSIEGHEFAGWIPAKELTADEQDAIESITNAIADLGLSFETIRALEKNLQQIEGDLVPTCECGWQGLPDDWISPSSRERLTGQQHVSHRHKAEMDRIIGHQAAQMAAAALDHAADAWDGDEAVAQCLRERAERIAEVGYYDGEEWPEPEQVDT